MRGKVRIPATLILNRDDIVMFAAMGIEEDGILRWMFDSSARYLATQQNTCKHDTGKKYGHCTQCGKEL